MKKTIKFDVSLILVFFIVIVGAMFFWTTDTHVKISGIMSGNYKAPDYYEDITSSSITINWDPGNKNTGTEYKVTIHYVDEDGNPILSEEALQKLITADDKLTTANKKLPIINGTDMYLDHMQTIQTNGLIYYYSHIMYGDFSNGEIIDQDIYAYGTGTKTEALFYNLKVGDGDLWNIDEEREMDANSDIYIVYNHYYEYSVNGDVYTIDWEVGETNYNINVHYVDVDGNTILNEEQLTEKMISDGKKTTGQELAVINATNLGFDHLKVIDSTEVATGYYYDHIEIKSSTGQETTKQVIYTYQAGNGDKSNRLFYNVYDGIHDNNLYAVETEKELEETVDVYVVYQPYPYYTVENDLYTVKWYANNTNVYSFKFHFVDKSGNEIVNGNEIFDNAPKINSLTNFMLNSTKEITVKNGKKYIFSRATLDNGQVIKPIIYSIMGNNNLFYNTYSGNYTGEQGYWLWDKNNEKAFTELENDIYLVYSEKLEELPTVETVDNQKLGFNMYMYNFTSEQLDAIEGLKVGYPAGGVATLGIYSNYLDENGFPVILGTGESLQKLYNEEDRVEANHLFLSSIYNNPVTKGILYYNSAENFAHFNEETGEFEVYDVIGTPSDVDQFFYSRGNFMPFNTIDNTNVRNYNWYTEVGTTVENGYGKDVYGFNEENDYNFGLYGSAIFTQNKGGIHNGKPMTISVTGDDDILIYIDGVLVIDLGGIHDAQSANIDLSTGKITWSNKSQGLVDMNYQTTTLKEIFNSITDEKIKEQLINKGWSGDSDTLADNTEHEIKIFYMERGESASNLKLNMNMPFKVDEISNGPITGEGENNTDINNPVTPEEDTNNTIPEKIINPITGDSINIGLLVFVMIISVVGIILCFSYLKTNKRRSK